jgi:hypothetical protein
MKESFSAREDCDQKDHEGTDDLPRDYAESLFPVPCSLFLAIDHLA